MVPIERPPMDEDEDKWRAFTFDFLREHMSRMYDDVSPKEVVDWLLWSWHFDKERMSKDDVLRHCLEHIVTGGKCTRGSSPARILTSASAR